MQVDGLRLGTLEADFCQEIASLNLRVEGPREVFGKRGSQTGLELSGVRSAASLTESGIVVVDFLIAGH